MEKTVQSSKFWIGKEVEGRLIGVPTFFASEIFDPAIIPDRIGHIFIVPELIAVVGKEALAQFVSSCASFYLTIGVFPGDIQKVAMFEAAHIMVYFTCPDFHLLKSTDSCKIEWKPYNNITFSLFTGVSATLKDYDNDVHFTD